MPVPPLAAKLTVHVSDVGSPSSFHCATTVTSSSTVIFVSTAPLSHWSNTFPSGAVKPLAGKVYSVPFSTVTGAIVPVPPLAAKLTVHVSDVGSPSSFHCATTVTSSSTVIFVSTAPLSHWSNTFPSGAMKPLAGRTYSAPFSTVTEFMVPVPPLASKLTVHVSGVGSPSSFHWAVTVTSSFTVIAAPAAPISHWSNTFPPGAVKPLAGKVYSVPFSTVTGAIVPVPPLASKLTVQVSGVSPPSSFHCAVTVTSSSTVIFVSTAPLSH